MSKFLRLLVAASMVSVIAATVLQAPLTIAIVVLIVLKLMGHLANGWLILAPFGVSIALITPALILLSYAVLTKNSKLIETLATMSKRFTRSKK